jgi:hypothetical protein
LEKEGMTVAKSPSGVNVIGVFFIGVFFIGVFFPKHP